MRDYATVKALRNGETVEIEGCRFVAADGELESGDWYVAERNRPAQLLTVRAVDHDNCFVVPVEPAYCFDLNECVKVREVTA